MRLNRQLGITEDQLPGQPVAPSQSSSSSLSGTVNGGNATSTNAVSRWLCQGSVGSDVVRVLIKYPLGGIGPIHSAHGNGGQTLGPRLLHMDPSKNLAQGNAQVGRFWIDISWGPPTVILSSIQ